MKISPFIFNRIWLPYAYGRQYPQSPLHILRWLLRTQYWSRDRIGEYQLEQIKMQLKEASDKSDYYKSALSGVDLGNLALTTLQSLPKLSKDVIQERSEELFTDKRDKGIRHKTSGSTGIPVEIYLSRDAEAYRRAGHLRMLHWWGIKPSDRSGLIWGNLEISQRKVNLLKRWKRDLLNREYFIDVFKLRSGTVEQYFQELVDFEPVYLRGYTSGLVQFAELVTSQHLDPAELKLKVIFVTSEILSEKDRRFISEIFGCPVANEYGAADGGLFAYECPEGGMHIFEEAVYIFTGEKGEACVNEYHNLLMPLINYEIGDRIEITDRQCLCGRKLRLISKIDGRLGDMVRRPDGNFLSNHIFTYLFKELADGGYRQAVKKWKVIQRGNEFTFQLVKGEEFSREVLDYIERFMNNKVGMTISIKYEFRSHITRESSGKLRYFIREK